MLFFVLKKFFSPKIDGIVVLAVAGAGGAGPVWYTNEI